MEQPKEKYVALTGKNLKLSCRVETAPGTTVQYQWFKCHKSGTGKEPCSWYDNEMILPAVSANQGYYVCSVTPSNSDSIISNVVHVEVVNSTNITIEPADQLPTDRYVELNEKLILKFKASCGHYPVKYHWYHNGKELTGFTDPVLIIESVGNRHIGSYYCEASSDYSATPLFSETCRVHWSKLLLCNRKFSTFFIRLK